MNVMRLAGAVDSVTNEPENQSAGGYVFMPTRKYFVHHAVVAPRIKKSKRPNHRGKMILIELGNGQWRAMSSREYAMLLGRSKGGLTAAERETAYRWTSELATKAIKKCWAKRWAKGKRIGVRLGRPAKLKKPVDRIFLRGFYAHNEIHGIEYVGQTMKGVHRWTRRGAEGTRVISEKQALTVLGHLAGMHRVIPRGKVLEVSGPHFTNIQPTKETA